MASVEDWLAVGIAIAGIIGVWVKLEIKLAQVVERFCRIEEKHDQHADLLESMRAAIQDLTKVMTRLTTIEEMRAQASRESKEMGDSWQGD